MFKLCLVIIYLFIWIIWAEWLVCWITIGFGWQNKTFPSLFIMVLHARVSFYKRDYHDIYSIRILKQVFQQSYSPFLGTVVWFSWDSPGHSFSPLMFSSPLRLVAMAAQSSSMLLQLQVFVFIGCKLDPLLTLSGPSAPQLLEWLYSVWVTT